MLAACTIHASHTGDSRLCRKLTLKAASQQEPFIQQIFSLCFSTDLILAEGNSSSVSINQGTTFITGPYLDGSGLCNVTSQISTHAYLPCRVSLKSFLFCWHVFYFDWKLYWVMWKSVPVRAVTWTPFETWESNTKQLIHQKSLKWAAKYVNVAVGVNSLKRLNQIETSKQCALQNAWCVTCPCTVDATMSKCLMNDN